MTEPRTFGDGWRYFWRVCRMRLSAIVGFAAAVLVFDIVGDVVFFVLKEIWQWSGR